MEDPDMAVATDMHADDLAPMAAIHALRDGRPLDEPIGIGKVCRLGIGLRLNAR